MNLKKDNFDKWCKNKIDENYILFTNSKYSIYNLLIQEYKEKA